MSAVATAASRPDHSPGSLLFVDPTTDPRWDRALDDCPDATFFHSGSWARVLKQTYGHEPIYLALAKGREFLPVLPLMEVRSAFTGRRGVSLPFSDACPALSAAERVEGTLVLDRLLAEGRRRCWRTYESRGAHAKAPIAKPSRRGFLHRLDLLPDAARQFSQCSGAARRAVRKAEQAGVRIDFRRDWPALEMYYALHCRTRRRFGLPPQSLDFFRQLHREAISRGAGLVALAERAGQSIAGAVFLCQGKNAIYKFASSDARDLRYRGNNLVLWSAIRWLAEHGFERLDLGRTVAHHHGLRRFKQAWGTVETPIDYAKYDLRRNCFLADPEQTSGFHTRLFRWLPVSVNRWLGRLLYPHLD